MIQELPWHLNYSIVVPAHEQEEAKLYCLASNQQGQGEQAVRVPNEKIWNWAWGHVPSRSYEMMPTVRSFDPLGTWERAFPPCL
jgi:hypothetical protein